MIASSVRNTTNPILEYWSWIRNNPKSVSRKVYKVYHQLDKLIHDPSSEWEYSPGKANHAIMFIERFCKHSKGALGGQPFLLELWQKALIAATFGIIHKIDGTRKFQEVMLIVARKNGKSTLAAAVGLYLQIADGEAGAECYAVATKRDQAKIIWQEAKRMVRKSPALTKKMKTLVAEIVSEWNDSFFRPLGSDSDTLDGLNVHGALLDEIHAWKDKNLYDVIVDGTSARNEPMIFITSTAGTIREGIYDIKYDEAEKVINGYEDEKGFKNERLLPIIYELDARKEWTEPDAWMKANPGLGTIKKLDQLSAKVNKAQSNSALVKNLLCKDFNIRETSSEAWLTFEQLNNTDTYDVKKLKPRYGIGGVDLSQTTDLTAACVMFRVFGDDTLYYKHMYWLPEELLELRVKEDRVPYDIWEEQGYLRTTPGNKVHYKYVVEWFKELQEKEDIYMVTVGYDSWSATYFVEDLKVSLGASVPLAVPQTMKVLSGPMHSLGADLSSKRVNYDNNPITKWCLSNTATIQDKNGNIKPAKTSSSRKRIDGLAAMLDAYVVYQDTQENYMNMI